MCLLWYCSDNRSYWSEYEQQSIVVYKIWPGIRFWEKKEIVWNEKVKVLKNHVIGVITKYLFWPLPRSCIWRDFMKFRVFRSFPENRFKGSAFSVLNFYRYFILYLTQIFITASFENFCVRFFEKASVNFSFQSPEMY